MTGSLAVENIFSIPGIGSLFVDCIKANDYPVIMGITIFYAAFYMLIVLLVDLAYSLIAVSYTHLGRFVVEESYYETNGKRHASPHLFLITETEQGILLSSYEIPEGEDKKVFSYASMKKVCLLYTSRCV